MLEKVADTSFSSQLSLFQNQSLSPVSFNHHRQQHPATNPLAGQPARNLEPYADSLSGPLLDSAGSKPDGTSEIKPKKMIISERTRLRQCSTEEDRSDDETDLDETLKGSPSLARGVEFDDNEAWESFSHGSPRPNYSTSRSDSQNSSPSSSASMTVWKSPRKELFEEIKGKDDLGSPVRTYARDRPCEATGTQGLDSKGFGVVLGGAEEHEDNERGSLVSSDNSVQSLSRNELSLKQTSAPWIFAEHDAAPLIHQHSDTSTHNSRSLASLDPFPPPSALVSRLFPALRKVDEHKNPPLDPRTNSNLLPPPPPPPGLQRQGLAKTPSPVSSAGGESGYRSLSSSSTIISEELRQKLSQLEEEIVRYRTENTSLESLRKEREEVGS